jgi:hypothetical protein
LDQERDRFCKETTYAAEYNKKNMAQDKYNKNIDNQIIAKYSNRIPKSAKAQSMDRTQHDRDRDHFNRQNSQE